jgi:hypothetical protein
MSAIVRCTRGEVAGLRDSGLRTMLQSNLGIDRTVLHEQQQQVEFTVSV